MFERIKNKFKAFLHNEDGASSIEFVLSFPVFMLFFGMTYENGMISARHVMLERGVDIAVRDIRIGRMPDPTRAQLRARICEVALLIPNCETQLELELIKRDPRAWAGLPGTVQCVDRGDPGQPKDEFVGVGNNELVFVRACARFDPVMPTVGIGKTIVDNNSGSAAGGSYALVAVSAFVVEPYQRDEDENG